VVARFRPQNKVELESGGEPIVQFQSEDTCELNVRPHRPALLSHYRKAIVSYVSRNAANFAIVEGDLYV
jgi:hypothetical protein